MIIEDQITSLELSKRLKELSVKQASLFYWIEDLDAEDKPCAILHYGYPVHGIDAQYSAFTIAELGEMFPKGTWLNVFFHSLEVQVQDKGTKKIFTDESEVNARAKLLIYLIENNLLKLS